MAQETGCKTVQLSDTSFLPSSNTNSTALLWRIIARKHSGNLLSFRSQYIWYFNSTKGQYFLTWCFYIWIKEQISPTSLSTPGGQGTRPCLVIPPYVLEPGLTALCVWWRNVDLHYVRNREAALVIKMLYVEHLQGIRRWVKLVRARWWWNLSILESSLTSGEKCVNHLSFSSLKQNLSLEIYSLSRLKHLQNSFPTPMTGGLLKFLV